MAEVSGYNRTQIALHWAIALLILYNYLFSEGMNKALDAQLAGTYTGFNTHVWIGVAVFVLVVLRLVVRLASGAPEAPGVPGSLAVKLADWGHKLLYLLMALVPVGGMIAWFGGVDAVGGGHALMANVLMIVAGLHAVMALVHQFVLKDHLLLRMMKAR